MGTIKEIISDAHKFNDSDVYYWDCLNDRGYHMHLLTDGSYICFKQTPRRTEVISPKAFEEVVNKTYCLPSCEDEYYGSFKNIK